jgi:hypothetical protein
MLESLNLPATPPTLRGDRVILRAPCERDIDDRLRYPIDHADALAALVNGLGVPTVAGRTSAIRLHLLEMPAPIVADALGYHQVTTAKLAAQAGGTWSRYAAGDHQRSPSGWTARRTHDS